MVFPAELDRAVGFAAASWKCAGCRVRVPHTPILRVGLEPS